MYTEQKELIVRIRLMILFVLVGFAVFVWVFVAGSAQLGDVSKDTLSVTFLDVGQGDAILIETPEGIQVLIDGGPSSGVLRSIGTHLSFFDRSIDMIVGTHPDKDHIGGLVDVLDRYEVGTILTTENTGETSVAQSYRTLITKEGAEIIFARSGQVFQLGASTTVRVLFPDIDPSKMESNTSSIVLQLTYGDIEFMLTGDSPKGVEEYLVLREGESLESEVLKLGHHGSRTSTSELFLEEVAPQFAVVSAEKDSRYGHPHTEVTDRVFNAGIQLVSTAEQGDITFLSDGKTVWLLE